MRSTRTGRGMRRLAAGAAVAALGLTGIAGCGVGDQVAGIHDVPAEQTGGAPLNEDTAQDIATRAIADASAAATRTGATGEKARRTTMTGSALSVADAMARSKQTPSDTDVLSEPATAEVLGIVRTSTWPRTMVTTTLDEESSTRSLQVLHSRTPTSPYLLDASVAMLGGASVPSLGTVSAGIQTVSDGKGIAVSPKDALDQLATALAYPKPATPKSLGTDDAFTRGVRAGAAAQAKALGKLGSFTQSHTVEDRLTQGYRLADGGALVFGQLRRVDTITPSKSAKQLTLPDEVARILGHRTTTKKVSVTYVEPVVLVVPTSGKATVVGAGEQLATARES